MNEKILIVDDQKKMVRMLKTCLEKEGYRTLEAYDGEQALELWRDERPDLVLLDVMMPKLDGLEFCRRVRERANTPIIIISAKSEETDRLVGLDLGADDYIVKPFSLREMIARVRSMLRRFKVSGEQTCDRIVEGGFTIDRTSHTVEVDGGSLTLTPTEFDMLFELASHPGRVFTRQELIASAQGGFFEGYDRTVDAHVGNIRKKLDEFTEKNIIETVYGVGYKFTP